MSDRSEELLPFDTQELHRLAALDQTGLLDTEPESVYDDITDLAADICQTPAAYIALVDGARQWFKSVRGLPCRETPRSGSICAYTVRRNQLTIVHDTSADPRFQNSPVVRGYGIRFYTGVPIRNRQGLALGSLCVVDFVPRTLTEAQNRALRTLACQVESQIALREQVAQLKAAEVQQAQLAAALAASEAQFRAFMDRSPAAAYIKDAKGRMLYYNPALARLYGVSTHTWLGKTDHELWPADLADTFRAADLAILHSGQEAELEEVTQLPGTQRQFWRSYKFPMRDGSGQLCLAGVSVNVTAEKQHAEQLRLANQKLESLTLTDPLTSVGNRRALDLALDHSVALARQNQGSFGMLMVDVDHFKQLNDTFGHAHGDLVLRRIGELLRSSVRRVDQVCRFGGEEFAILLPEADLLHAESIGERIRYEIERLDLSPSRVTVSIGIAVWSDRFTAPAEILHLADHALYQAKRAGRNRVEIAA